MPSRRVLLRGKVYGSGDGILKYGSGTGVSGTFYRSMRSSATLVFFLDLGAIWPLTIDIITILSF